MKAESLSMKLPMLNHSSCTLPVPCHRARLGIAWLAPAKDTVAFGPGKEQPLRPYALVIEHFFGANPMWSSFEANPVHIKNSTICAGKFCQIGDGTWDCFADSRPMTQI